MCRLNQICFQYVLYGFFAEFLDTFHSYYDLKISENNYFCAVEHSFVFSVLFIFNIQ